MAAVTAMSPFTERGRIEWCQGPGLTPAVAVDLWFLRTFIAACSCTGALTVIGFGLLILVAPSTASTSTTSLGRQQVHWCYAAFLGWRYKGNYSRDWILHLLVSQGCWCWPTMAVPAHCWGCSVWLQPLGKLRDSFLGGAHPHPGVAAGGQGTVCSPLPGTSPGILLK